MESLISNPKLPKTWKIVPLSDLGTFSKGAGITKDELIAKGLPCIRYGEIYTRHHIIIKSFFSFISTDTAKISKRIFKNDILFAGSGETLEDIGKAVAFIGDEIAYAGGDIVIFTNKKAETLFMAFLLNSATVLRQTRKMGQGQSVVHIYANELKKLLIPLPPLPEQKKIAQILFTWDRAIEKLDELIEAKKRLKKGLMQQLLTGKMRFPEFKGSGLYKNEKIKNFCKTFSGGTPSRIVKEYYNGKIPWIKSGELNSSIINKTNENISELGLSNSSAKMVQKGTLLIALYGATAGVLAFSNIRAAINQAVLALVPNTDLITKEFLYYFLEYKISDFLSSFVQGGQPNLSSSIVNNFKVPLPILPEQKMIAHFLSISDNSIRILEAQKKYEEKAKKGLMQNLLSGKIQLSKTDL